MLSSLNSVVNISICLAISKKSLLYLVKAVPVNNIVTAKTGIITFRFKSVFMVYLFNKQDEDS
jgi:hypothetical protein